MSEMTIARGVLVGAALMAAVGCGSTVPTHPTSATLLQPPPPLPPLEIRADPQLQAYTERGGFPEYIIGPDDVLEITLREVVVTKETVTVRPDGNVSFSLVENVRAGGRTATELDSSLTAELAKFLRDPKIDVEVVEFRSKMVSLLGALQKTTGGVGVSGQGRYPLRRKTTILDIILVAGGATPDAQLERVQLIRGGRSYRLDLQRVLNTGEKTHNVVLQGGDIVIVPGTNLRSKKVILLGEVTNPNVYMFSEGASLLEALGQAGGMTGRAQRDDIRVIRVVDGQPTMLRLSFDRVTSGGDYSQNLALRNDDIIYVPRSFMGDVNEVISQIQPLLQFLLLPATYRDLYTTGGGLRIETGEAEGSTGFVRTLPGTAAGKATTPAPPEDGDSEKEDAN